MISRKLLLLSSSALMMQVALTARAETFDVTTGEQFIDAAAQGGTINVMNDINIANNPREFEGSGQTWLISDPITFTKDTTINGNGHKITGEGFNASSNWQYYMPVENAKLNIDNVIFSNFNLEHNYVGVLNYLNGASADNVNVTFQDNNAKSSMIAVGSYSIASDPNFSQPYIKSLSITARNNNIPTSNGGILNVVYGVVDNISGTFENNLAKIGIIENHAVIRNIEGEFRNNKLVNETETDTYSDTNGTISLHGYTDTVTGIFENNEASGINVTAHGAAVDVEGGATGTFDDGTKWTGRVNFIDGTYTGNFVKSNVRAFGGAVAASSRANVGTIQGTYKNNYAETYASGLASGGAVSVSEGTVENIYGTYENNYAKATESGKAYGGAISTQQLYPDERNLQPAKIDNIKATFTGNYAIGEDSATANGGAIYNGRKATINTIEADFVNNYVLAESSTRGGAVFNHGTINELKGTFKGNYAKSDNSDAQGGAIFGNDGSIDSINADFDGNYVVAKKGAYGGAIANYATINQISGNFTNNYVKSSNAAAGGAIFNMSNPLTITNSNFINNYVEGDANAKGGAITSGQELTIVADNGKSEFTGNYVLADGQKTSNAIYQATASINLEAKNNGQIIFNDGIDGTERGYNLNITGDTSSRVEFNNSIQNANMNIESTNVNVARGELLNHNNALTMASGVLNIANMGSEVVELKGLNLSGGTINIASTDADLANKQMGRLSSATMTTGNTVINVDSINLTSDSAEIETAVSFVDATAAKQVKNNVTSALSPVYRYGVTYNNETGEFVFTRPTGDSVDNFNPSVFSGSVMAASSLNTQGDLIKQVVNIGAGNLESFGYSYGRVWAMPFYSDDTVEYKDFYDIDSTNYGIIAGVDSKTFGSANGTKAVFTAFGAYTYGENKYQGIKIENNSWMAGLKASFYNGGFYGDAIVNYAWHDGESKTSMDTDSIDTNGYGISLRAGYKFNQLRNRWKADASLLLSWQKVESDDYTAKSGAEIKNDDYSRLTLTPQIKVGYRALKYWTPYALVRYNFILSEDGNASVNNIALPELESKDYVEYGIGVETANLGAHNLYGHILRHEIGRSGWSATAGYRYNF